MKQLKADLIQSLYKQDTNLFVQEDCDRN